MNRTLVLIVLLAACGDKHPGTPPADAGADGAVNLDSESTRPFAVAVASDYMTPAGVMSTLDVSDLMVTQNVAAGVAGMDPVVREYDGTLYVINRAGGENVTVLDAHTFALEDQLATGTGSNPQDVAVVGDKLYVPALGSSGVVVLTRGSGESATIDLATPLGDPDGKPDCVSAYAVGTEVYVACGLLDASFDPRGPGKVAIIDTANDSVRAIVTLPYANPQGMFVREPPGGMFGDDLLIPLATSFTDYTTGCLAWVTVGASSTAGCAVSNHDLGGIVSRAAVDPSGQTWLAVASYDMSYTEVSGVLRAMASSGTLGAPVSKTNEMIIDVAACPDGTLVAADTTTNAKGLRVYASGAERTTDALPLGLPPVQNGIVCYAK